MKGWTNTLSLLLFVSLLIIPFSTTRAASVGTASWKSMPNTVVNYWWQPPDYCGRENESFCEWWVTPEPVPFALTIGRFSYFNYRNYDNPITASDVKGGAYDLNIIDDGTYTYIWNKNDLTKNLYWKEVFCNAGQVMVGTRFYEATFELDEEHFDAECAKLNGATVGPGHWISAPNAFWGDKAPLRKIAKCASDEVMTGIRFIGASTILNEEHVDVFCSRITGTTLGDEYVAIPPNAYSTVWGGYKVASCNTGDVMTGANWYNFYKEVDDEHADAYCRPLPTASVKIEFL